MNSNNKAFNIVVRIFKYSTIFLIALKLMKIINWSWWWVLTPVWLAIIMVTVVLIVFISISRMFEIFYSSRRFSSAFFFLSHTHPCQLCPNEGLESRRCLTRHSRVQHPLRTFRSESVLRWTSLHGKSREEKVTGRERPEADIVARARGWSKSHGQKHAA